MKKMSSDQIGSFVDDVIATGCEITAIAGVGYVIGDADLSDEQFEAVAPELNRIIERYGDRDHLLEEITAYLVSIGRFVSVPPSLDAGTLH